MKPVDDDVRIHELHISVSHGVANSVWEEVTDVVDSAVELSILDVIDFAISDIISG